MANGRAVFEGDLIHDWTSRPTLLGLTPLGVFFFKSWSSDRWWIWAFYIHHKVPCTVFHHCHFQTVKCRHREIQWLSPDLAVEWNSDLKVAPPSSQTSTVCGLSGVRGALFLAAPCESTKVPRTLGEESEAKKQQVDSFCLDLPRNPSIHWVCL